MKIDMDALYDAARWRALDAWRRSSPIDTAAALSDLRAIAAVLEQQWSLARTAELDELLGSVRACIARVDRALRAGLGPRA